MIQGEKICLRVVTQADLALLNVWANDLQVTGEYGSFGLISAVTVERGFAENGLLSSQYGRLLVVIPDDTPVGFVSYHRVGYGPNEGK